MRLAKAKWVKRARRYLELLRQRGGVDVAKEYRRRFKQRDFDKALHTEGGAA